MVHFVSECLKPDPADRPPASLLLKVSDRGCKQLGLKTCIPVQHRWLRSACSRDNIKDVLSRVFLKSELDYMGFNI